MSELIKSAENELALPNMLPEGLQDQALLKQLTNAKSFLPMFKFYSSQTNECKEGKFPALHYGVSKSKKDTLIDLGKEPVIIPITYHWKALQKTDSGYLSYHNPSSPQFEHVRNIATGENGHMWGPEVLVYICDPDSGDIKYASWYLIAKSVRPVCTELMAFQNKAVRLGSQMLENKAKQRWPIPTVNAASQPANMPDRDELIRIATDFNTVVDSQVEVAPETPEAATSRD